ncbi:MAG TPA: translocation/assembly module TamB domain-containing protein, partial [Puia sp.]|nr:translocation/assembly module TamB domain-containing protein [Puia sp.]
NDFRSTYKDIVTFIPSLRAIKQPRIDRIEQLRFRGNFTGYIHDFVTSGTIETNLGTVVSNVNMKLPLNRPSIYSGTIITENFDLGRFMDDGSLGKFSFEGKVNGEGLTSKTLNATLDGKVHRLDFNDYTYHNIQVNGTVTQKKYNGRLVSVDSNLNARLDGLIDFSHEQPRFDFSAEVTSSRLKNLHFTRDEIDFDGKLRFNFSGDNIDNFLGVARIYDASIYKKGQRISFDSLTLESSIIDSNKTITVLSNEFDGAIVGSFSIKELPAAFQTFLNRYYPSYIKPNQTKLSNQNFSFVITTKKVDDYIDFFDHNLKGFNYSSITGRIDSKGNLLDLNADVPQFNYKNISFYKVDLKGRGNFDSLTMETNMGEVFVSDSLHFPSTHIKLKSFNDLSEVQIKTSANQTLNAANISARVQTFADGARITFNPSTFDINSKTWTIDKNGELSFSKNIVSSEGLKIYNGEQQILISTHPSSEGSWNDVHVDLKKINIGDFTPYLVKSERIEGVLTGTVDISDPFHRTYAQFSGVADQFRFENDSIGLLKLSANYNKVSGLVNTKVGSDNKDYHFDMNAVFNTLDSAAEPIHIELPNLVNTKIDLLEKYLGGIFSNMTGLASGQLQITGPPDHLKYIGDIKLKDASLRVNYTQCTYTIPSATVQLRDGYIDFGSFILKDTLGNTAEMGKARLSHHSFRDLRYDFELNTSRLLMLNTRVTDNNQFYGTLIGRANMTLRGPNEDMQMRITGEPVDSSNIYLPTTTSKESADADFIVWKVYGKEMKPQSRRSQDNNFTVTLDITANNYANVYVIIDPLTKDIIKANGHGNLHLKVGTTENMDMRGRYEIDRGNYNFSFQSFIRKPFILKEGVGNYIQWTGNPYDADINIQAVYEAENVQFGDLGYNITGTTEGEKLKSYHGKVWVIATLSNKLMK